MLKILKIQAGKNEKNYKADQIITLQLIDEKFEQLSTPFLYKDKNIFLFFTHNDELYDDIQFESLVSFTILRNVKDRKTKKADFNPRLRTDQWEVKW